MSEGLGRTLGATADGYCGNCCSQQRKGAGDKRIATGKYPEKDQRTDKRRNGDLALAAWCERDG